MRHLQTHISGNTLAAQRQQDKQQAKSDRAVQICSNNMRCWYISHSSDNNSNNSSKYLTRWCAERRIWSGKSVKPQRSNVCFPNNGSRCPGACGDGKLVLITYVHSYKHQIYIHMFVHTVTIKAFKRLPILKFFKSFPLILWSQIGWFLGLQRNFFLGGLNFFFGLDRMIFQVDYLPIQTGLTSFWPDEIRWLSGFSR